ncbi:MAG: hypothetical protein JNK15_10420 [Planctomycetes bacterium]|nr:hypothetical protein [Planctomycetota bacterium]
MDANARIQTAPPPAALVRAAWPLAMGALALSAADFFVRLTFRGRALHAEAPWSWFVATAEWTVPTFFSVAVTFATGVGCLRPRAERDLAWCAMGVLFCYLAVDDLCMLHEAFGEWLHPWLGGIGAYVWVCTLGPVFALCGAWCAWRLLRALAGQRVRRACLFLGFAGLAAALGFEVFEDAAAGSGARLRGIPLVSYTQWVEEALELLAPVLLFAAAWTRPPVRT